MNPPAALSPAWALWLTARRWRPVRCAGCRRRWNVRDDVARFRCTCGLLQRNPGQRVRAW